MSTVSLSTQANQITEIRLQSRSVYKDPFNEITLDAIFIDPSGTTRKIPAFWAGSDIWCIRYASPILGLHYFTTVCSDTGNAGLHDYTGVIEVILYNGDNPLWRHGAPRVADDNRHFAHADGTPFFWLGDTWWMGLTKRLSWPNEFQQLTKDRVSKGFSVVQIVAGLLPDMAAFDVRGANENGFPWEENYSSIRPQFFDAADTRMMHLVAQGIVPCILGGWGYYLFWLGTDKMKQHWRYLVARWGALPVIWAVAGEQTMPWYLSKTREADSARLKQGWTEVTRYLRQIDGFGRMITTHPHHSARESVDDPSLLDFEMQQTGHRNPTLLHANSAVEGWQGSPVMPVVNGESRYEALDILPSVTTKNTRQAFWAHLLNSGCAGHTYGANGVWQVNRHGAPFGKSPGGNNWGEMPWDKAIHLSGSHQLALAKNFLLGLTWYQLEGAGIRLNWKQKLTSLIFRCHQTPISAAIACDKSLALYYLLSAQPYRQNMEVFPAPVIASWFDPTNGEIIPISGSTIANKGKYQFTPPPKNADGESDWLLVLQSQ